jgi:hypothetical protein
VGAFTPASFRFQCERREETVEVMVLTGGSHLSARGRERGVPVRVLREVGRGLLLEVGQIVSPGSSSIFILFCFFSISVFLISFKHFPNLIQKDSNQLCKVSKIQNNHTEQ